MTLKSMIQNANPAFFKKGASCRLLAQLSVQPVALKCIRLEKHFSDWESSHECSLKPEQQL